MADDAISFIHSFIKLPITKDKEREQQEKTGA